MSNDDAIPMPAAGLPSDRMPGHWLLARLGKRVLRPGGRELTGCLVDDLRISPADDVVEIAPGLGTTTQLVLGRNPNSYVAVDRDAAAVERVRRTVAQQRCTVVRGTAAQTGLPDSSADVVFGEAYLTMQPGAHKRHVLDELARIARPGARLGLHEVALVPDDITSDVEEEVERALTSAIKVSVSPLTLRGWMALVDSAGFEVVTTHTAPLHLLEPRRLLHDEGIVGAARFIARALGDREARARVQAMRSAMRRHHDHLQACAITAVRRPR